MAGRKLVREGTVLTMDPELGDLHGADVLIEDDRIAQVGTDLQVEDAEVIEAAGRIVIPGFVDTHRHTWEAAIRGCAPNATLDDYFVEVLDTFAPKYRPEDVYASNLAGSRECLNAGITTLHVGMGRLAGRYSMVKHLDRLGLLGPDTTYVHACYLDDEEWQLVRDSGGTISIAPQVELQMGHGCPPTGRSYAMDLRPSLSIDVVTTVPGDMFTQMRAAFGNERYLVNSECWTADVDIPDTILTARQVLEMATIHGAEVAGLADRTGSLTPGKQADLVIVDGGAPNMAPLIDPVAAVTLSTDASNVEAVLVAGDFRKRDGKLVDGFDRARRLVEESRDHLISQVTKQPDWIAV